MTPVTARAPAPAWAIEALGAGAAEFERVPWGFTNATWAGTAADGVRYVATRMASPATAAALIRRAPEIGRRLAAVGLATAAPIPGRSDAELGVIVSTWIDGTPGMRRLGTPDGAADVGAALGIAWRALGRVAPGGMGLDDTWTRPADLQKRAQHWLESVRSDLPPAVGNRLATRVSQVAALLEGRRSAFVHGDLVPANVLLRPGLPPALLDYEGCRVADPLLDAAWFSWIVRYHHPGEHAAAWAAFATAVDLEPTPAESELLVVLPSVRILEILSGEDLGPASRARWLDQLVATAAATAADR